MANELNIDFRQTGLTVTATLVQGTAAVGSAINLSESGTLPGFYSGDMPAVAAGIYNVRFQSTTNRTGRGVIAWNGTAEVIIPETQIRAALGLASANMDTQLGNIPTTTEIWTHATRALTDKDNFNLASSQTFSTTGSVGSVTGAVTVGTINNNAITANVIATDAIDADAIAASAVTEIQSGLATQASVDTKASQGSVDAIPTTPLLAVNYTAPDNAGIAAIKAKTDNLPSDPADQSELASLISAIPTAPLLATNYTAPDNAGIAAIKAKTDNLPSDPADQSELATLISAIPTTPLLAANYTAPDNAGIAAIKAKTDNLPSDPADQSELATLISAIPTNPLLAANYTAPDNASIAAIKAKTDNLPSDPADQSELATLISAIPTTPLLAANYTAPDNAGVAAIKAKTDNLPSDPADQSELAALISAIPTNPLLATNYTAPDNASIAAIKAKTDNLPSDPADQSELVTLINTRLAAADYVAPDNTGILTAIGALPSASTITNSVWNAALSNYTGPGSTGAKLGLASTLTVGDIPAGLSAQQVWEYATRTLTTASGLTTEQNARLNELWRKAGLDLATPVVRILNPATGNVTETLGTTTITHTESNSGNTVTSARQP